jgi:archaemetzincin
MDQREKRITIQPLGDVEQGPLACIRAALEAAFAISPILLPALPLPTAAWMASRRQYDSTGLILFLASQACGLEGKVLGVCDTDLCTPILTFVYGTAEVGGQFAVVSLHRLRQEVYGLPPDSHLFLKRCAKEAVHETGHVLGLKHCFRYTCVMHPSTSVGETDLKREAFCPDCRSALAKSGWC